jgi:hypothetical protein
MDGETIAIIASLVSAIVYTNKMLVDKISEKLDKVLEKLAECCIRYGSNGKNRKT